MSRRNEISSDNSELTPLSDRLGLLLVVRLFMAITVLITTMVLSDLVLSPISILTAQVYAVVAIFVELLHRLATRFTPWRWIFLVNVMLIMDGIFVAVVLAGSGEARSTFIFLAYAHIVSVTLLVGFRTGLKMALWQSMLLLTVYYLGLAGVLKSTGFEEVSNKKLAGQLEVAQAIALWLVAICTAGFASLNERELRRRKGELTIIADLATAIEQTRRPSEILQELVSTTADKLGCSRAVALCAHGGSILIVGGDSTPSIKGDSMRALGGLIERAVDDANPLLVKHVEQSENPVLWDAMPGANNVAFIPLIAEGECVAVLVAEFGTSSKRRVTRPMIDLLSNVAGRVALSLSNTFLLAEVQRLASVDGLTGLPNRRTFNQAIEREVARSQRSGQPVSLVMLDIDHFKSVNDTYGHQMGDTVLAESAAGVMEACRGEDLPARYGGEEIAVIMPNCSAEQALAAAERIRAGLGFSQRCA